jgi:two-component system, chemotaxis family, chemotaxis protein CheY
MGTEAPIIALIDDDKIFQLTASKTILSTQVTDKILQFENGEKALEYIKQNVSHRENLPDFIFLDINMPFVDGWMFLEDYTNFKSKLAKPVVIYMVSSSIDPRDIKRARENSDVKEYVIKPVSRDKFLELLKKVA